MDWWAFVLGAATAVVTQTVALLVEFKRQKWTEAATRRRRVEERTEEAANELLETLYELRATFEGCWKYGSEPEEKVTSPLTSKIQRKAQLLSDPEARRHLTVIAEVIDQNHAVQQFGGDRPVKIAYVETDIGRENLGALLRTEALPADSSKLNAYHATLLEYYEVMELQNEPAAEKRTEST